MQIENIVFNVLKQSSRNTIRYWQKEKSEGLSFDGEYIELQTPFILNDTLNIILDQGFQITKIDTLKINADVYSKILFRRDIGFVINVKAHRNAQKLTFAKEAVQELAEQTTDTKIKAQLTSLLDQLNK